MINRAKSREIYQYLRNGKILNQEMISNSGELVNNPIFSEIMGNLEDYRKLYLDIGYRLVDTPSYLYLIDDRHQDPKTDVVMRIYLLLVIIGKYLVIQGYSLNKIYHETAGLTVDDFHNMANVPHIIEILEKSKMGQHPNEISGLIKSNLIDRGILWEKPSTNTYILTNAGRAFFDELQNNSDLYLNTSEADGTDEY